MINKTIRSKEIIGYSIKEKGIVNKRLIKNAIL